MDGLSQEEAKKLQKEIQQFKKDLKKTMKVFSNRIVISKTLEITGSGKIKLRNLSSNPSSGSIGEIACVGGKLKICTATTPTWTIVGTQT